MRGDRYDWETPPQAGGCWICHRDEGEMAFSIEFDTFYHPDCLEKVGADTLLEYETGSMANWLHQCQGCGRVSSRQLPVTRCEWRHTIQSLSDRLPW